MGATKITYRDNYFEVLFPSYHDKAQPITTFRIATSTFDLIELKDKIKQLTHEQYQENFYFFADS